MISSERHFNALHNNEENTDDEGWGSDFEDSTTEYLQEIEENRINEQREAVLTKTASYENSIMEQMSNEIDANFPIQATPKTETIQRTGFSYLANNSLPNIQGHQTTTPRYENEGATTRMKQNVCEIENSAVTSNQLNSSITSTRMIQQDSFVPSHASNNVKKVPGKLHPGAFDFLKKLNSEVVKTETVNDGLKLKNAEPSDCPPPLPERPPPVFKYPLLKHSTQTTDLSKHGLGAINKHATQQKSVTNNTVHYQNETRFETANVSSKSSSSCGNSLPVHARSLSQPAVPPRPEIPPQILTKRPISLPINKSLRNLLENADGSLKTCAQVENPTIERELKAGAVKNDEKPEIPRKPGKLLKYPMEQNVSDQYLNDLRYPSRRSVAITEYLVADATEEKTIPGIPIEDDLIKNSMSRRSLPIPPDRSRLNTTEMTKSQEENLNDSPQLPEFDPWQHSMDRPSLPQKLKNSQRSLSCNSLVQSFKDLSLAMWFPPEKERKTSLTSPNVKIQRKVGREELTISHMSLTTPPVLEEPAISEEKSLTPMEQASITRNLWYHEVDGTEAQRRLLKMDLDGAFLVRPSSRPTNNIHYTVSVTRSGRVLNTHIREKENGHYAIGKEKKDEKTFPSISELIKYYQEVPFEIRPSGSSTTYGVYFRITPPR